MTSTNDAGRIRMVIVALSMTSLPACDRSHSSDDSPKAVEPATIQALADSLVVAPTATQQLTIPHAEVTADTERACKQICSRSSQLKCAHPDQCMGNCIAMATFTPCSESLLGLYHCLVNQPLGHWECAEDGVAAIRDGFCDKEQSQAVACMQGKMQPKQ